MNPTQSRRRFLTVAGASAAALAATSKSHADQEPTKAKIVAVSCSPRKGMTTATGLSVCLQAAQEVDPERIDTELIELAGLSIPWEPAVGMALEEGRKDDFPAVADKLADPAVQAIVIGTPVYYASMSALCKSFLERFGMFRRQDFAMSGKIGAVLTVGGARSGGQELTIQSVQTVLLCQEMIVVGEGRPTGHFGARLWNRNDDVLEDEFGISTAQNLGHRLARMLLS
jgi:multimeric flavodoxin WrbA